MSEVPAPSTGNPRHPFYLAGNGALMILVGLMVGPAIPAATYPWLMLTAHIQFLVNGMVSVFAGLLLKASISVVGRKGGLVVVWGHVLAWAVCLSEVAAAFWGAKQTLPIAAGQASAPGAEAWQESVVNACHVIPALVMIAAWMILVAGVVKGFRRGNAAVGG